ncbi:MAG: GerMN domain-containing protein [Thermodesulfovibrionales bacterium]
MTIKRAQKNYKRYPIFLGIIVLLIVLGGVGYFLYYIKGDIRQVFQKQSLKDTNTASTQGFDISLNGFMSVRLFFPSGVELRQQDIRLPSNPVVPQMIESIVVEFIKLLPEDMRDIQIYSAYKDKEGIVYLDFNAVLTNKTVFDATREYLFLKSIYQSLITNIQGLTDIRILVEGREIESIGGHFNISNGMRSIVQ